MADNQIYTSSNVQKMFQKKNKGKKWKKKKKMEDRKKTQIKLVEIKTIWSEMKNTLYRINNRLFTEGIKITELEYIVTGTIKYETQREDRKTVLKTVNVL